MGIKDLTLEQLEWFEANFDHTKNAVLAGKLGTSSSSVSRMARELGLWKTEEFVAAMQRNAAVHAARVNRATGGNAGKENLLRYGRAFCFRKGERQKDRMSPEAYGEMCRRRGKSVSEAYRAERRRVLFGLEQKTRLRVCRCSREKISLRSNLRKRGYEIARSSNEAIVTDNTRRSAIMEARATQMGIRFNF